MEGSDGAGLLEWMKTTSNQIRARNHITFPLLLSNQYQSKGIGGIPGHFQKFPFCYWESNHLEVHISQSARGKVTSKVAFPPKISINPGCFTSNYSALDSQ